MLIKENNGKPRLQNKEKNENWGEHMWNKTLLNLFLFNISKKWTKTMVNDNKSQFAQLQMIFYLNI